MIGDFMIGFLAGTGVEITSRLVDFLRKENTFVNHDLQKAVRRSYFSALHDIISDCREELKQNDQPVLGIYPSSECRKGLNWLNQKDKYLEKERKEQSDLVSFHSLNEIQSLLNPSGTSAQEIIQEVKQKIVAEVLKDDAAPLCYQEAVKEKLFEQMCLYFAKEIKDKPNVRHIFDSQVLVQIDFRLQRIQETLCSPKPETLAEQDADLSDSERNPIPENLLEMVGGAMPLDSKFYVERPVDADFQAALSRRDSIVLLKGARQVGKTSLLARGMQKARDEGVQVILTDFQKFIDVQLQSLESFFFAVGEIIADQLNIDVCPQDTWKEKRAPNTNFERYFRREILGTTQKPVLWAMDEADRLFHCSFGSEIFAMFRTWHNERALTPGGPCSRLTLAIAYATEANLFIKDQNQSPFNVGTKLLLEDFSFENVADLNQRHGSPLNDSDLQRFYQLTGGQRYLIRRALNDMVAQNMSFDEFAAKADHEDGTFGDHLRRILFVLNRNPELKKVLCGVLQGKPCPDYDSFYRLRGGGLIKGESKDNVTMRCEIYAAYLRKHFPC